MKKILALLLTVAFLLSNIGLAFADNPEKNTPTVVEIKDMVEHSNSEVKLKEVKALKLSDGSVTISAKGSKKVGDPAVAYELELDLASGTYKTTLKPVKKSKDNVDVTTTQSHRTFNPEAKRSPAKTGVVSIMDSGSGTQHGTYVSGQRYRAKVETYTEDPPGYDLAMLRQTLEWTINSNGTVTYNTRSTSAWAANPSPPGTHWYVDSNFFAGSPYYSAGNTSVSTDAKGEFHNYDFGDASLATYATHNLTLEGLNDYWYNYSYNVTHTGEYSYLLKTYVIAY